MKRTLVASHQQSLFGLLSPAQQLHQGVVHKVICCVDERNEDLQIGQGGLLLRLSRIFCCLTSKGDL